MAVQERPKKPARSGNPAKRATARPAQPQTQPGAPTSAGSWKSKSDAEIITLPSGNTAKVRRTGPEAFLQQGLIPDMLTPIVEEAINKKKGLRPQKQAELLNDPKALGSLIEMLDRTLVYAVVEPHVEMPPTCVFVDGDDHLCGELDIQSAKQHHDQNLDDYHEFVEGERDPNILYADRVDFDDKMFIMNFCVGGTRDLEQFRKETGTSMAGIFDSQIMQQQAE